MVSGGGPMGADGGNDVREGLKPRFGIRVVLIWALLAGSVVMAQQSVPNADFVVSRPVVNMYKSATADSEVTSQVLYGTGVLSLDKQGNWIRIRTADDYTGWVGSADVSAQRGSSYAPEGKLVRVAALSANIYREPDVTEHAPVLRFPWESILEVAADSPKDDARWLKVRLVDGQTAWVQHGDVEEKGAPLSIDEMLRVARRFLETTYTWGGTSSFGFDCSGFTQMLVRQRGIEMPRDADLQAGWTGVISVDRKDLQPGDLLFFGSSASRITHTGMYLGHGEFIHDTTHDHPGVQISRLDDMPWTKLLVATRRVKQ
jgi:gamma-D-glutamyl-L-lysine dipeptidyl-peptidase